MDIHSSKISREMNRELFFLIANRLKYDDIRQMKNVKQQKKPSHYCLLVNQAATNYNDSHIKKLTSAIRKQGDSYTVFEPESAFKLLNTSLKAVGIKKWHQDVPKTFLQRGKVTTLVACGGDGTVNLVGRAGFKANIPVAILPMGKFNNIAKSLHKDITEDTAIKNILKGNTQKIDVGMVGDQIFLGSAALGFTPQMQKLMSTTSLSRFAFRWGQNAGKAVTDVKANSLVVKIDAFRFEIKPTILNINLLSHSVGIPISPTSIPNDNHAEIIVDFQNNKKSVSQFIRQLYKEKYIYNDEFKLFRGQHISIQPVKDEILYLDGELIVLPNDVLDIVMNEHQLQVIC